MNSLRLDLSFKTTLNSVDGKDIDKKEPWVTGVCILSNDSLLIADFYKKALKLVVIRSLGFTLYDRHFISTLYPTSPPWDVTCLPGDQAAATLPQEKKIQVLSTHGQLKIVRHVKVSGMCRGICYTDAKLLVTYQNMGEDVGKLEIMSLEGTVYRTVTTDCKGNTVFIYPNYVTVLKMNTYRAKYIYVTDWRNDTITKLTMQGDIVVQFKDNSLLTLCGLVGIGDNHIAVCCRGKRKIPVIKDYDEKIEIVKHWDCGKYSQAIEFFSHDNTLYISFDGINNKGKISVYDLS